MLYQSETYKIIGACMEVHRILGRGHLEAIYSDALEFEFQLNSIPFERQVKFEIAYKEIVLPHYYFADFVVYNKIILEIKAIVQLDKCHFKQTLNYLAASKLRVGLVVNFGEESLNHKRIIF
jgi:GxxExxY protein